MANLKVLVTAATVSELAQNLLREGGVEPVFMNTPIDEDMLIGALAQPDVAAVLLRGSPPFT